MSAHKFIMKAIGRERSAIGPIAVVVLVALLRFLGEGLLGGREMQSEIPLYFNEAALVDVTHNCLFYAAAFWGIGAILAIFARRRFRLLTVPICLGLLLGVVPPVVDTLLSGRAGFRYMYVTTPTLFHYAHQPPGETVAVWLAVLGSAGFVLYVTRSLWRTVFALLGVYLFFQLTAFLIPWSLTQVWSELRPEHLNLCFWGLCFSLFLSVRWRSLSKTLKRVNHAVPLALLTLSGACWALEPLVTTFVKVFIMLAAVWIATGLHDHHHIDKVTGERQVGGHDAAWLWFFFVSGAVATLLWNQPVGLLLFVGLVSLTLYHSPATRLKRIFCVSYKIEGLGGMVSFLVGAIPAGRNSLPDVLLLPALFAFGGQALISGLKDWKDMDEDMNARVYTHYTLALHRGVDPAIVHRRLVALSGIALSLAPALLGGYFGWSFLLVPLGVFAILPMVWVVLVEDRKRAVEGMFWLLAPYLLVLAIAMRVLSPLEVGWQSRPEPDVVIRGAGWIDSD